MRVVNKWINVFFRYLQPRQHGIELLFLSSGFTAASIYYLKKVLDPKSLSFQLLSNFKPKGDRTITEKLLIASLLGSFTVTVIHKILRKNKLFMLQPCHMSASLLLLTLLTRSNNNPTIRAATDLLFNIYLHTQWGGYAALVFPDTRDHYLKGETFNFFAGNFIIAFICNCIITRSKYRTCPNCSSTYLYDIQRKIPCFTTF